MNGNKEVWCVVKSSDNQGGERWNGICQKCCLYCEGKPCKHRTCSLKDKDDLCCWQASPTEWMMGRIDERAEKFVYKRRQREYWLREGHRPNDGTWEGKKLAEWWIKYPDVYEEMLAEVYGNDSKVYEKRSKESLG